MKIHSSHILSAHQADSIPLLGGLFQKALELEHATIPIYLTALYSIKQGTNKEITTVIQSVVIEEMLHITIVCNIMNALNVPPSFLYKEFIPHFPTELPMGIAEHLQVGLYPYSRANHSA